MIQRKQTLFLLLALHCAVACLMVPIASIEPVGMGLNTMLWNFGTIAPNQGINFTHVTLFILLAVTILLDTIAVLKYRKRMFQTKLCLWSILLNFLWYAYLAFVVLTLDKEMGTFHLRWSVIFPFCGILLTLLAYRGIVKDEKLVRSADRIR